MNGAIGGKWSYLVRLIRLVEWRDPPGSTRVVLVPRDGSHPPLQCGIVDLLWVDPTGVFSTRIQPHRVAPVLEWLDAPPKENLQKVHAGRAVANQLNYSLHQHFHLSLLLQNYFQRGGLVHSTHGEGREPGRLHWRRPVLAVEPGRLPPSD